MKQAEGSVRKQKGGERTQTVLFWWSSPVFSVAHRAAVIPEPREELPCAPSLLGRAIAPKTTWKQTSSSTPLRLNKRSFPACSSKRTTMQNQVLYFTYLKSKLVAISSGCKVPPEAVGIASRVSRGVRLPPSFLIHKATQRFPLQLLQILWKIRDWLLYDWHTHTRAHEGETTPHVITPSEKTSGNGLCGVPEHTG